MNPCFSIQMIKISIFFRKYRQNLVSDGFKKRQDQQAQIKRNKSTANFGYNIYSLLHYLYNFSKALIYWVFEMSTS